MAVCNNNNNTSTLIPVAFLKIATAVRARKHRLVVYVVGIPAR